MDCYLVPPVQVSCAPDVEIDISANQTCVLSIYSRLTCYKCECIINTAPTMDFSVPSPRVSSASDTAVEISTR